MGELLIKSGRMRMRLAVCLCVHIHTSVLYYSSSQSVRFLVSETRRFDGVELTH